MTVSIMLTVNYHVFIACIEREVGRTESSSFKKIFIRFLISYHITLLPFKTIKYLGTRNFLHSYALLLIFH